MNPTVSSFYAKNPEENYGGTYDEQHGPRLDELVAHYNLRETLAGKRVVDVGGGLGFLGKRLGLDVTYLIIDGAQIERAQLLGDFGLYRADIDYQHFGQELSLDWAETTYRQQLIHKHLPADAAFCLETIEHCGNPHHVIAEIKRLVKLGGDVYLSIPTETVTHNAPYPSLLWPTCNFAQFLVQMALPIVDAYTYVPKDRGWPAYTFKCVNRPWSEKRLLFEKSEPKFRDCTPLEATNL